MNSFLPLNAVPFFFSEEKNKIPGKRYRYVSAWMDYSMSLLIICAIWSRVTSMLFFGKTSSFSA
jgi:hypothetical protein